MSEMDREEIKRLIAGALFDFVGYLTSLQHPVKFGANEPVPEAIDVLRQWARARGHGSYEWLNGAEVLDWNNVLVGADR